jgi:hypothetical protein
MDYSRCTDAIPGCVWPTTPCFLTLGIEMAPSAMSEKAPATLEAGDILQTRAAGLVV